MWKSLLIIIFLLLGLFFPSAAGAAWLIRPFLMTLLFFSFLNVAISREAFHRGQLYASLLLVPVSLAVFYLANLYDADLAITLFLVSLAPTAVITPVLLDLLRRKVAYAVGSILISHTVFAFALPLLFPLTLGVELDTAGLANIFVTVSTTVLVPLLAAQCFRWVGGKALSAVKALGGYSFGLFLFNLFVASAKLAAFFAEGRPIRWGYLTVLGLGSLLLCLALFYLGSLLLRPRMRIEGALGMGRKNTMIVIWVALTYVNPLATLAPMLYILWQNLLVAVMIFRSPGQVQENTG